MLEQPKFLASNLAELQYPTLSTQTPPPINIKVNGTDVVLLNPHSNTVVDRLATPPAPDENIRVENLPAFLDDQNVLFIHSTHTLVCPIFSSQVPFWEAADATLPITEASTLASLLLWARPHKNFLKLCLKALSFEKTGSSSPFPAGVPEGFHLAWLQILEKVQARKLPQDLLLKSPLDFLENYFLQANKSHLFTENASETNSLIKSLKRGIIVSMALQNPQELARAKAFLTRAKGQPPKDNTWKSLADLSQLCK